MDGKTTQHANALYVGALVEELMRAGVTDFCVSPGSRSTPLALTLARTAGARMWMHLDERSAAFFGLGLAKASGRPVALVCTSGTAAANYLPALVEARLARVPLVALTADRPHELRDNGAPQTIDQLGIYGGHVKWFADLPEPDAAPALLRHARVQAARAVAAALDRPMGPVHLNLPLREPLVPALMGPAPTTARPGEQPYVRVTAGRRELAPAALAELAARLGQWRRGLIVCGPECPPDLAPAVARLAARLGFPILADPLSGVRRGPHDRGLVLSAYDAFLRDESFAAAYGPEVVLRFGAMPTAKPLLLFLQRHAGCHQIVVDGGGGWQEPTNLAAELVYADEARLCEALEAALAGADPAGELAHAPARLTLWSRPWLTAERATRQAIDSYMAGLREPFEGRVFADLAEILPDGATLYLGNSMPVRDADTFLPAGAGRLRILGNRGANGIDGVVSSALGAAAAGGGPLTLVIGDISLFHDSNGLLAARQHGIDATIVLVNNDGGGIFSFLPQASEADHFERLFGTPHGLDFRPLAELYGARYTCAEDREAFRAAVASGQAGGLHLVELRTDRQRNVALHRAIWPLVGEALARAGVVAE